jgi:multiple sugar transport system permease protein
VSYYLPTIVSAVVMTIVWSFLLNSSGVIAFFTREAGLGFVNFLGDPNLALGTVIFITLTINIGTVVILYIAAMASVPVDVLEAAEIDGASRWKRIVFIIVPLVRSTTVFIVITNVVAVLRLFVIIDLLTGGGPTYATTTIMYYLYVDAFKFGRMGRASAIGVIMFLIAFVISIPLIRTELKSDSKGGKL